VPGTRDDAQDVQKQPRNSTGTRDPTPMDELMKVVLIRHAEAGDRAAFAETGKPDAERPITKKGRRQMRAASRGLRKLIKRADVVASSPLLRAKQTAKVLSKRYRKPASEMIAVLEPGSAPEGFAEWANTHAEAQVVMAVGHEPHLGALATWLITGSPDSAIEFEKGGAALIEFDAAPQKGNGRLKWLMGPKELAAQD
jgi:phosphohistidine phosphatase